MGDGKTFRVLSLDGGGMRGTYAATYLSCLASGFSNRRGVGELDLGKGFDLIVGTSTGAIIGCGLAAGKSLASMVKLYREAGPSIFRRPVPSSAWGVPSDIRKRPVALAEGDEALRKALTGVLGEETIEQVYARRGIALAITAVEMSQHRSWVFKTQHMPGSNGRDNKYRLVDVCLASSAAPIFRSMAKIPSPDGLGSNVFVDGGLWANNPSLVGLIEALGMTSEDDHIEVYCMGTCPMPAGETVDDVNLNRGLSDWQFGGAVAGLSIDAQEFAFDHMAQMTSRHVKRASCRVLRFPSEKAPAALMPHLALDDTSAAAINALISQARTDANMTNSRCSNESDKDGQMLCRLFSEIPELPKEPGESASANGGTENV